MRVKKIVLEDIYLKMIEKEFKENKVKSEESALIYFGSYYINKFLHTDLSIKAYIGWKKKEQIKDVFILTFSIDKLKSKKNKKILMRYFEEGIQNNERYIGFIKGESYIGFMFKHDDEILTAYKTGQYSKISEFKKNKMKKFRVIDYDIKVRAFYIVGNENNDDWKNYPMGKRDILAYELYKMIMPEFFYNVLAEQFNVNVEYLKKNTVQILPKPQLDKEYLEIGDKDEIYYFEDNRSK